MARRWCQRGWDVVGTYRTLSTEVRKLEAEGMVLVQCDLTDDKSVTAACGTIKEAASPWDVLVLCPGTLEPIGTFDECDFSDWEESIKVNFTSQLKILHQLLSHRADSTSENGLPSVLFFAGGGTNDAPTRYSAYIIAKIALIKMCELLDAEIADVKFSIVGPGMVRTKIHEETLRAGVRAGPNYQQVIDKLTADECAPMDRVLDCCDWLVYAPCEIVSGRNFSVVYDAWGTEDLRRQLNEDQDMYKLRRSGNDWSAG